MGSVECKCLQRHISFCAQSIARAVLPAQQISSKSNRFHKGDETCILGLSL